MFTPNEDRSGRRRSSNISPRSINPDQTGPRSSTTQTPESSTATIVSQLREINLQENENRITIPSGCVSFCQHGNCTDPNCNSYWSLPLTPQIENRSTEVNKENVDSDSRLKTPPFTSPGAARTEKKSTPTNNSGRDRRESPIYENLLTPQIENRRRSTEVNKENVGSDSRLKTPPFTSPGAARTEKKTTPTNNSGRDRRESPIYENLLVYKATEVTVIESPPRDVSNQTRVPPSGHGLSESEKRDTPSQIPVGRGNRALPPSGNLNRSNENFANTSSTLNPTRISSSTLGSSNTQTLSSENVRRPTASRVSELVKTFSATPASSESDRRHISSQNVRERNRNYGQSVLVGNTFPPRNVPSVLTTAKSLRAGTTPMSGERNTDNRRPPFRNNFNATNGGSTRLSHQPGSSSIDAQSSIPSQIPIRRQEHTSTDNLNESKERILNTESTYTPRRRISPLNLLKVRKIDNKDALDGARRRIENLGSAVEEVPEENVLELIPEITSMERHLPLVSCEQLPEYSKATVGMGVQIQEIDIGQPCLDCGKCKGYEAHTWRKNCKNCKCPRDNHAISEFAARSRIGFSSNNEAFDPRTLGYTFVPSGITKANQAAQYYTLLPSNEVPKIGSEGEVKRSKRLVKQLPKQDLALTACKFVENNQKGSYQDFVQARNEIALDIGYVKPSASSGTCEYCEKTIPSGQYSVSALKMNDAQWHPACFRCTECDDLLVDLAYCVYKDKIYCERHYAECLKPRCEGCDELIFGGEYTKAMNKDWHGQHFCCWQCDESLTGQRYVLRDDHPYCVSCCESVFANACEKCSRTIGIDSKDLSYKDKHWHEACFLCTTCGESLVDKQFGSKGERIYCGRCYDNQFASRCDGCNEIFRAGTKKMEYKTRQWHEKCFCCCVCKVPIGTQSFIPREQEIYCAKCYEEKFATRCIKCNKVITSGGVTYKNEPWHRECFTCTHCSKSLAGERFTSRDDKPYCAECFGELFAKRCFACNKPITGIGGTKFISFEDRHWHNDCFFCAMCRTSLVGRGFITDQDDIICPECAKQKLL